MARTPVIKVTSRNYSYRQMVERADPKRRTEPEVAYKFSNNRKFNAKRDPYK
jgi:hypothetical protein